MLGFAVSANSDTIVGSRHDLYWGMSGPGMALFNVYNDYGEVCVYCHTPHGADSGSEAPLWNRAAPSGPYTPYSSDTMDMTPPDMPSSISLACLSCHDGTIAVDDVINMPGSGWSPGGTKGDLDSWINPSGYVSYHGKLSTIGDGGSDCAVSCHTDDGFADTDYITGALSTDLSDDHPISMGYPSSDDDPYFNDPGDVVTTGGLKLFGATNRVECASCHNVHDPQFTPFLRKANTGSALCYTCHDK
jgi:predicted CXXCH cytochrome family protein